MRSRTEKPWLVASKCLTRPPSFRWPGPAPSAFSQPAVHRLQCRLETSSIRETHDPVSNTRGAFVPPLPPRSTTRRCLHSALSLMGSTMEPNASAFSLCVAFEKSSHPGRALARDSRGTGADRTHCRTGAKHQAAETSRIPSAQRWRAPLAPWRAASVRRAARAGTRPSGPTRRSPKPDERPWGRSRA